MRTTILALLIAGCSGPEFRASAFHDLQELDSGAQAALQGGSGGEAADAKPQASGGLQGAGGSARGGDGGKLSGAGGLPVLAEDSGARGVSPPAAGGSDPGAGGSSGSGGSTSDPMDAVLAARRDCVESPMVPCSEWRATVDTRVVGLACTGVSTPMPVDWCHASGVGGWCCVP